jgi:hypothetical protein
MLPPLPALSEDAVEVAEAFVAIADGEKDREKLGDEVAAIAEEEERTRAMLFFLDARFLPPGRQVTIHGLAAKPELNGQLAVVTGPRPDGKVRFPLRPLAARGTTMLLRPANLKLVAEHDEEDEEEDDEEEEEESEEEEDEDEEEQERLRLEAEATARARAAEAEAIARARADAVAAELLAEEASERSKSTKSKKSAKSKKAAAGPPPASVPAGADGATSAADRALEAAGADGATSAADRALEAAGADGATSAADRALEAAMASLDLECLRSAIETHSDMASAEVLARARAKRTRLKQKVLKKKASKAAKSGGGADAATTSRDEEVEPPSELVCPITNEIMKDPVFTEDGQTYERAAIERWLATHDTAPLTGEKLAGRNLTPNVMARGMCRRWQEEHGTTQAVELH